ncbi:MAG TPA: hypothetical protein VKU89_05550 [Solirubrobacteraceae bacterium]|nr:hypothetical protein [Solirubrobacteraceae bacterium]
MPTERRKRAARKKVTCAECFFKQHELCALGLTEPCPTFRPAAEELRPPRQLRFVFRNNHGVAGTWAFPSAEERAALHEEAAAHAERLRETQPQRDMMGSI